MYHNDVFNKYSEVFPDTVKNLKTWFPNGFNSIRLRFQDKSEWVFTIHNDNSWGLRSLNHIVEING